MTEVEDFFPDEWGKNIYEEENIDERLGFVFFLMEHYIISLKDL